MHPFDQAIQDLGLELPPTPKPVGSYVPVAISGALAFLSGQISKNVDGSIVTGKLGRELTLEQGKEAAKIAALNAVSIIKNLIGFEEVSRIVRVTGYVHAMPDFFEIPQVVNGASDLFLAVFGEKGIHARSAVGMAALPLNAAVEIEVTVELTGAAKFS